MIVKMLEKLFKSVNPLEIIQGWLLEACKDLALSAYWICIIGGLIGLIFYVCGLKKGKDLAMISPILYLIVKIIGGMLLGV